MSFTTDVVWLLDSWLQEVRIQHWLAIMTFLAKQGLIAEFTVLVFLISGS